MPASSCCSNRMAQSTMEKIHSPDPLSTFPQLIYRTSLTRKRLQRLPLKSTWCHQSLCLWSSHNSSRSSNLMSWQGYKEATSRRTSYGSLWLGTLDVIWKKRRCLRKNMREYFQNQSPSGGNHFAGLLMFPQNLLISQGSRTLFSYLSPPIASFAANDWFMKFRYSWDPLLRIYGLVTFKFLTIVTNGIACNSILSRLCITYGANLYLKSRT